MDGDVTARWASGQPDAASTPAARSRPTSGQVQELSCPVSRMTAPTPSTAACVVNAAVRKGCRPVRTQVRQQDRAGQAEVVDAENVIRPGQGTVAVL